MARLRAQGLSLAEIGRQFGVSKQAVQDTLSRLGRMASFPCAGCGAEVAAAPDAGPVLWRACRARRGNAPFAVRLQACRLAAGLTQAELARRIGVSGRTVANWENENYRPNPEALRCLAEVLGEGLLGGSEQRP
jgi:transcriptional regulator with XRE-family HTH domain